ncbi:hypothetical protein [Nocardioides acrostichi]|uniref:PQQ-binding-like beta-propeller repeat protein n=1 Tax=Nocardioides acrostichi TaxID=2784339 RepID=A0A930Y771_9ACTN|nr:hypothetical protein [Nocardioides acrostichi]MBF4161691.1 hypothetical protein [Nocardioides acrostichi]
MSRIPALITTLAVALGCLAACSGEAPPERAPTATASRGPSPKTFAWRTQAPVFGQPIGAGGVGVVYESAPGERFRVVAFDPHTGRRLWRDEVSPSFTIDGDHLTPVTVTLKRRQGEESTYVAYFTPRDSGNLHADLMVVRPRTGEPVRIAYDRLFRTDPETCPDGRNVCVLALDEQTDSIRTYRLDAAGHLDVTHQYADEGKEQFGLGLVLDDDGSRDLLQRVDSDRQVVWSRPITDVFPGAQWETQRWFTRSGGTYIAALGPPSEITTSAGIATKRTPDLRKARMTAFDAHTGRTLWSVGGVVPCLDWHGWAVADEGERGPQARRGDPDSSVPWVRCRANGGYEYRSTEADSAYSLRSVVLEGFDPTTGKTTWRLPLSPTDQLLQGDQVPFLDRTTAVVSTRRGREQVDLKSGRHRLAGQDATLHCLDDARARYREPIYYDDAPIYYRNGGTLVVPCGPEGRPDGSSHRVGAAMADRWGSTIDGVDVVATRDGLEAYSQARNTT